MNKILNILILPLIFFGCTSTEVTSRTTYELPPVPLERRIRTEVLKKGQPAQEDGLLLNVTDARNFLKNEVELKNYIEKLTLLLKTIDKSHNIDFNGEWYK